MKVFLLTLIFSIPFAFAEDSGIKVSGTGEVKTTPDIASISFAINTISTSASTAQKENAKITNSVVAKLKSSNVAAKDIQTSGFHVGPEYEYKNSRRTLKGHRVTHSFNVTIRKTANLGDIIDDLTQKAGEAIAINNISFGVSDDEPLKMRSLELGVENARKKAEVLAKAAGVKLGEIELIEEQSSSIVVPMRGMEMMKAASADAATQIESGEVGVNSSVRVHFKIKD
ncbi:MAG: SIMPL domain-containing protein [bacterium]|tara:strand:- start:8956 stop:9639 length:684 start_codon:yes stop_codon:yes gene_type:complete